jgi:hypothetical protein
VLHGVVLGAFCSTQVPVAGAHTLTLQGLVGVGHCTCEPAWQTPFWQVSRVQRLLSRSHGVPLVLTPLGGHVALLPVQVAATSH